VHVDATFAQPIDLLDLVITPGAGVAQDVFTQQGRPESLEVTLTRADGTATTKTINLNDSPGAETFAVRGNDVVSIRLTIKSAFQAQGSNTGTEPAIAEIKFFAKSGGG